VEESITPDLLFEAHSSVLDLVFYDADQFPADCHGHALVALKVSWNRSEPTGYKVVRVTFKDGKPDYENFMTGFWASGEQRAEVWGRPAALAAAKDGSLLVADDTGGTWRVTYTGVQSTRQTSTAGSAIVTLSSPRAGRKPLAPSAKLHALHRILVFSGACRSNRSLPDGQALRTPPSSAGRTRAFMLSL